MISEREPPQASDPLENCTLAEIREALSAAALLVARIKDLEDDVWMNAEDAASAIGYRSGAALLKTDAPRRHPTPRVILFNLRELKIWIDRKPAA